MKLIFKTLTENPFVHFDYLKTFDTSPNPTYITSGNER